MAWIYILDKDIAFDGFEIVDRIRVPKIFIFHFFGDEYEYSSRTNSPTIKDMIKLIKYSLKQNPLSRWKFEQVPIDLANNKILPKLRSFDKDYFVAIEE